VAKAEAYIWYVEHFATHHNAVDRTFCDAINVSPLHAPSLQLLMNDLQAGGVFLYDQGGILHPGVEIVIGKNRENGDA
jgi:hypothetical protein